MGKRRGDRITGLTGSGAIQSIPFILSKVLLCGLGVSSEAGERRESGLEQAPFCGPRRTARPQKGTVMTRNSGQNRAHPRRRAPWLVCGIAFAAVYMALWLICATFWSHEYGVPWMIMIGASYPAVLLSEPVETLLGLPESISIPSISLVIYFGIGCGLRRLLGEIGAPGSAENAES